MGRNKKHKKQLRSEKSKIKLKDHKTKFLPKGLNVTDASFKIKPIVLLEQLKTYEAGVIVSKRNISIKNLFDRLDHHNRAMKEYACVQLKQLLEDNKDIIVEYLPDLLKRLCPLILHDEYSVRQKVLKTIEVVLSRANTASLAPFYPILMSFLRTSLTHIKRTIREDSLHLLDVFLRHAPRMLAQNADSLLPIYLSLMACNVSSTGVSPNKKQRVLSVDLSSEMTSVRWRVKVLVRLHGMLEAIAESEGKCYVDHDNGSNIEAPIIEITKNKSFPLNVDYFDDTVSEKLYIYTGQRNRDSIDSVSRNIQNILSILIDTWSEVAPEKNNFIDNAEDTILCVETAEILNGILKIIYLLWHTILKKSDISIFYTSELESFFNGLLRLFPFHKRVSSQKKQTAQSGDDQRCSQENLILCYIFSVMNPKLHRQDKIDFAKKIARYLNTCLKNRGVIKPKNITYLTKCLSIIFKKNASRWHKINCVNMDELLRNTINFQITSSFNKELFNVLCDLTQEKSICSLPAFETFLSNIPSLLCKKEISSDTIDKIHWISVQGNETFITSLLECMPDILNNLPDLQVIAPPSKLSNKKLKILYMFAYCPEVSNGQMEFFKAFVDSMNEESEYSKFVKHFIILKDQQ